MRRLVVAAVLIGDRVAVNRIMHEGVDHVIGGDGGGIDAQLGRIRCTGDDFLAPVAKDIGGQVRGVLGTVVGQGTFEHIKDIHIVGFPVVLVDGLGGVTVGSADVLAVGHFRQQVAVPVSTPVAGEVDALGFRDDLAVDLSLIHIWPCSGGA